MNIDEIKELWMNGDGANIIIKRLDLKCNPITIYRLAKKNNWMRISNQEKTNKSIIAKSKEILELFDNGIQASEISRKLDLKSYNVLRFLRRNGRTPKDLHYDFNFREDIRKKRAEIGKLAWENGKLDFSPLLTPQAKQKSLLGNLERWKDPQYKEKMSVIARDRWYKNKMWEKMRKFKETRPENAVADILDLLDINYKRNYRIGEFSVDFYCQDNNLLLEIDGEYWHGRFSDKHKQVTYVIQKDIRKNDYIRNNRKERYIRLWEQYTLSRESLITILQQVTGKVVNVKNFELSNLKIKEIAQSESRLFIEKYHYLMTLGPFSKIFGAFLDDLLVAVCVFKYPTYATNNGCLELSRFCIHPSYQIKNMASYVLSKVIKAIDAKNIISYSDTTQNHNGTIYKAANFTEVGMTSPSYYYVDEYNAKYHKKVIYNHAIKMKMSESEYVHKTGLKKVTEQPKKKFIFIKSS
jgi:very-short-patch-repair endonuclease